MTIGSESDVIYLLIILFVSTLTRSTFGFGDGITAMPLLAMTIGITVATPLVALVAITIAVTILVKNWRDVDFKDTWQLILASLVGIPVGIYLLKGINEGLIKFILAILVIFFGLYNLFKPTLVKLSDKRWGYGFGFFAGILGGAYNINGLAVAFYGILRRWSPGAFRVTLQGYFFVVGILIILGHALAGNYTPKVLSYYVISLPIVCLAIFIGGKLNRRIPTEHFIKYVYIILIIIGVLLLINSLKG